jgi:hypothetical protein
VNEGKDDNKVGKRSGTKEGGKAGREMQGRREELMWEKREGKGRGRECKDMARTGWSANERHINVKKEQ